jgi:hypothetical protein
LKLRTPGLIDTASRIVLVRASDGAEIPGCTVTLGAPDDLRLEVGEDLSPARLQQSVRIEGPGAAFAPFDLVWLGPNAWKLQSVRVNDAELSNAGTPCRLDPSGLALEVAIAGDGRDDVAWISAHGGRRRPDRVSSPLASAAKSGSSAPTSALFQLPPGAARFTIHAEDKARGAHEIAIPADDRLGRARGEGGALPPGADGSCSPFNHMNGRYMLAPTSKSRLRVTPNREARLDWRLHLEGEGSSRLGTTPEPRSGTKSSSISRPSRPLPSRPDRSSSGSTTANASSAPGRSRAAPSR